VVVVTLFGSAGRSASGVAAMEALSWSASLSSPASEGVAAGAVDAEADWLGTGVEVGDGAAGVVGVAAVVVGVATAGLTGFALSLAASFSFFFLGLTTISRSMVSLTIFFAGVMRTLS